MHQISLLLLLLLLLRCNYHYHGSTEKWKQGEKEQ